MKRIAVLACLLVSFASQADMLKAQDPGRCMPAESYADPHGAEAAIGNARARLDYFYNRVTYPGGSIPEGARARAWKQAVESMRLYKPAGDNAAERGHEWVNKGPFNIGGRIPAVAVNPKNPNTIFIGAADGGVWRSWNEGRSWHSVSDDWPAQAMGAIAIDPVDTNIVYAGTGEANFGGIMFDGGGVFKSADGGTTWNEIGNGYLPPYSRASDIVIDPRNPSTLYIAVPQGPRADSSQGLYKSTDGGATWRMVLDGRMTDVVLDPSNPDVIYTVSSTVIDGWPTARSGMYKSEDGGENWTLLEVGLPPESMGRTSIAISESNPGILFIGVSSPVVSGQRTWLQGLFKTTDAGATWEECPVPYDYLVSQGWFDNIIGIHPADPNIVYAGGISLIRSSDGGATWERIPDWYTGGLLHVDQHAIAFNPVDPDRVYIGNDGGFFVITSGGKTVEKRDYGLSITQFVGGAMHPATDEYLLGGTQDNGTMNSFASPDFDLVLRGDGGNSAVDRTRPNIVYGMQQYVNFWRSEDFGRSWTRSVNGMLNDQSLFYIDYDIDPNDPNTLYLGTYRLYKTTDGARSWTQASACLFPVGGSCYYISAVGVSSWDSRHVYAGSTSGWIAASQDGGLNWTVVSEGLPEGNCSAVRSFSPGIVYAAYSRYGVDKVWKSEDYGHTWTSINGNLPDIPVTDIIRLAEALIVATDIGVFISDDEGASWQRFGTGMPSVSVQKFKYSANTGTLRAITHGRGQYDLAWKTPPASAPEFLSRPDTTTLEAGQPFAYAPVVRAFPSPGFRLLEAPEGASVDPKLGFVQWEGKAGAARFTIQAENASGSAVQSFTLSVNGAPLTDWRIIASAPEAARSSSISKAPGALWLGRDSGRIARSTDLGRTWEEHTLQGTASNVTAVHGFDRWNAIAATAGGQVMKTGSGGADWRTVYSLINGRFDNLWFWNDREGIAISPGYRDSADVYFTSDGGETWQLSGTPRAYARAPLANTLHFHDRLRGWYAYAADGLRPAKDATVLRTTDGGLTWLPATAGTRRVSGIAFLTPTVGHLVDSYSGRVRRTVNGGVTWITAYYPMNGSRTVDVHADTASRTLWILTDSSAWISSNQGNAWTRTTLVPAGPVQASVVYDSGFAIAVTQSGIVQQYGVPSPAGATAATAVPARLGIGRMHPQPARDAVVIPFITNTRARLTGRIHDQAGRLIAELFDSEFHAGEHFTAWAPGELSSGVYFFTLFSGREKAVARILIAR